MATRTRAKNNADVADSNSTQTYPMMLREGRDEMNLVEFPISLLTNSSVPQKTMRYRVVSTGRRGELNTKEWVVTGSDAYGLPIAGDEEIYIGLMELAHRSGFEDSKTYFSRYELVELMGLSRSGASYDRIAEALNRLAGMRVVMNESFWDNKAKKLISANIGLIQQVRLVHEKQGRKSSGSSKEQPKSFVQWNEDIIKSIRHGYVKFIDTQFYFELSTPTAKRLYRFLDKKFYKKTTLQLEIKVLGHEQIGVSRKYTKLSHIFRTLEVGLKELLQKGFLSYYERKGEYLICSRGTAAKKLPRIYISHEAEKNGGADNEREILISGLIARGVARTVAKDLVNPLADDDLAPVANFLEYFDYLLREKGSYGPGFLVWTIREKNWQLPPTFVTKAQSASQLALFEQTTREDSQRELEILAYGEYKNAIREKTYAEMSPIEREEIQMAARTQLANDTDKIGDYFKRCIRLKNEDVVNRLIGCKVGELIDNKLRGNTMSLPQFLASGDLIRFLDISRKKQSETSPMD